MKIVIVLLALVALSTASLLPSHSDFEAFLSKFPRSYSLGSSEYETRFAIFRRNELKARWETFRANGLYVMSAMNSPFGDRTSEELKSLTMAPQPAQVLAVSCLAKGVITDLSKLPVRSIPTSWDWRTKNVVTPVKDQQQCGSCWCFSTAGAIESAYAIKYGASRLVNLSEQEIVDCSHACVDEPPYGNVCNQGCGGGWPWSALTDIMSWGGLATEQQYPYRAIDQNCQRDNSMKTAAISNYTCLSGKGRTDDGPVPEDKMAQFIYENGPVTVAIDASSLSMYSSGIWNPSYCSNTQLDHALVAVGYGHDAATNLDYWLIKNSWGLGWGMNGYFKMVRGNNLCGVATGVAFPLIK